MRTLFNVPQKPDFYTLIYGRKSGKLTETIALIAILLNICEEMINLSERRDAASKFKATLCPNILSSWVHALFQIRLASD